MHSPSHKTLDVHLVVASTTIVTSADAMHLTPPPPRRASSSNFPSVLVREITPARAPRRVPSALTLAKSPVSNQYALRSPIHRQLITYRTLPTPTPATRYSDLVPISEVTVEEEYDCGYLNLGAESPHSTGSISPFSFNEDRPPANWKPGPSASARRGSVNAGSGGNNNSNNGGNQKKKTSGPDRDCGICFEYAVKPLRTLCCGKIFCEQDLRDWLHGPNASGLCPNCDVPCTLEDNTLSLVSPSLRSPPPPPRKRSQQFDRTMSGQRHVPSPLSTSEPITHHRKRSSSPKGLGISTEKPAQQTSPLSEKQTLSSSPLSPLSAAHWSLPSASTTTTTTTSHSHSTSKSTNPLTILTSSLPLGLTPSKSTHGSTTPSMWNNGKVFSKGGKVPKGSVIDSFLTERKEDRYGMLVRLLTLIAVLGVLYVIMG